MMIILEPLQQEDRNQFILDNQEAFRYGAMEEFGMRDNHFEEEGEIISRSTIEACLDHPKAEAYRIMKDDEPVGGVILLIDKEKHEGDLDILFVSPKTHSRGIGQKAWHLVEEMHPEIDVWVTHTPYFEKRNIHFYVNRLGFHIVEFFHEGHQDPNHPDEEGVMDDGMFKFEKRISQREIIADRDKNV